PAAGDGAARVRDAPTGRQVHTLEGPTGSVYGVCFSPDGRLLASAGGDFHHSWKLGEIKLWNTPTGRERFTLKGRGRTVYSVCFSPDGRRLASRRHDQTLRLLGTAPCP